MTRITSSMTLADIGKLPGFEPLADYLMECDQGSYEGNYLVPLTELGGQPSVEATLMGLERLDELVQTRSDIALDIWSEAEKAEVPGRARTKLVFFPGDPGAPFVMVVPGGGYGCVCSYLEGYPAAAHLNTAGYNAFVLSYRTREDARFPAPLEDLAQALRYVLGHADSLVMGQRYALMGFSAGAHLAGCMVDAAHGWHTFGLPRPEAVVLNYPALDLRTLAVPGAHRFVVGMIDAMFGGAPSAEQLEEWSVNLNVDESFPPAYLWQCEDDDVVPLSNLRRMDARLSELGIPHEALTYARGGHGLAKPHDAEADAWTDGAIAFLRRWL